MESVLWRVVGSAHAQTVAAEVCKPSAYDRVLNAAAAFVETILSNGPLALGWAVSVLFMYVIYKLALYIKSMIDEGANEAVKRAETAAVMAAAMRSMSEEIREIAKKTC